MRSLPPESDTEQEAAGYEGPTDFGSLMSGGFAQRTVEKAQAPTDFATLKKESFAPLRKYQKRTATDWVVEVVTPVMIFVLVYSVISFLLEVRYVYLDFRYLDRFQELDETLLRSTAFFIVLGIVALNRLVARDGSNESVLYSITLMMSIGLYTCSTTDRIGSVANTFMNKPVLATLFNVALVGALWWITNRLMHECCVDENPVAGEIGILTGTARRLHNAITNASLPTGIRRRDDPIMPPNDLVAVDPSQWKKPEKRTVSGALAATTRLPVRHPGVSIFYASVPALIFFVVGQWVLRNGKIEMALWANLRVYTYTIAALALLNLTSLGGLREYFRQRNVRIPGSLGPFWLGLGIVMIAMVMVGATFLPAPSLTAMVMRSDETLSTADVIAARFPQLSIYLNIAEKVVMAAMLLVLGYAALRGIEALAVAIARSSLGQSPAVKRFFNALDRVLQRFLRIPTLPTLRRPARVRRNVALSVKYRNPLGDSATRPSMSPTEIVEYSYGALCALAQDLAVPRRTDQTPFEFIRAFPPQLETLRPDAIKLTNLFVVSAYSNITLDERTLDTVRGFWRAYEIVRAAAIR